MQVSYLWCVCVGVGGQQTQVQLTAWSDCAYLAGSCLTLSPGELTVVVTLITILVNVAFQLDTEGSPRP